ncbi:MAG TPA: hypothetical protein VF476_17210 [Chitinophagaceae bacterium]
MRYLLIAIAFILFSCKQSAISKQLSGSDSLVLQFNHPQSNMIAKTVTTTETSAIRRLAQFVDGKGSTLFKCGYDGNMIFFSKGEQKGDISFQYSIDSCRHFVFDMDGELKAARMNNEAADFLKSLAEGRNAY